MQEILNQVLIAVLTIAIPFIVTIIFRAIEGLLSRWESQTMVMKDGLVKNRLIEFEAIVRKAVIATEATLKRDIVGASKDGKITKDEAKELMDKTIQTVRSTTTDDTKKLLSDIGIDLEAAVRAEAESFLEGIKNRFRSTDTK